MQEVVSGLNFSATKVDKCQDLGCSCHQHAALNLCERIKPLTQSQVIAHIELVLINVDLVIHARTDATCTDVSGRQHNACAGALIVFEDGARKLRVQMVAECGAKR